MTEEHDFNIYPEKLTHSKYLQTGKILIWISAVLSLIFLIFSIYLKAIPLSEQSNKIFLLSVISIGNYIKTFVVFAIYLIFRYYLCNYNLPTVRKMILLYIGINIISMIWSGFIYPHAFTYMHKIIMNSEPPATTSVFQIAAIITTLPSLFISICNIIISIYIGIKLQKYKDDYIGGLNPLGIAFILYATSNIFAKLVNFVSNLFLYNVHLPRVVAGSIIDIVTTAFGLYVLYRFYQILSNAQQYKTTKSSENM